MPPSQPSRHAPPPLKNAIAQSFLEEANMHSRKAFAAETVRPTVEHLLKAIIALDSAVVALQEGEKAPRMSIPVTPCPPAPASECEPRTVDELLRESAHATSPRDVEEGDDDDLGEE